MATRPNNCPDCGARLLANQPFCAGCGMPAPAHSKDNTPGQPAIQTRANRAQPARTQELADNLGKAGMNLIGAGCSFLLLGPLILILIAGVVILLNL